MRSIRVVLTIAGAVLVLPTLLHAQAGEGQLPVSLERIRAALQEQPRPALQLPAPSDDLLPTYRLEVSAPLPLWLFVEERQFDPTMGLPSGGELVMNGIGKMRSAVVKYKRNRAQRRARKEVEEALAEFCAVHACPTATGNK